MDESTTKKPEKERMASPKADEHDWELCYCYFEKQINIYPFTRAD